MNNNVILKKYNQGIKLDLGCGENKQEGFVGIDIRKLKGVDIVHDLEKFPYPLPDECASLAIASHLVEHINPHKGVFIDFMNEVWRLLKPNGEFIIGTPYAGSPGYYQDPTHCFSLDTDVLTENGWKAMVDIKKGDKLVVLKKNNKVEISECVNFELRDFDGSLLNFKTKRMNLLVTPEHNLYCGTNNKNYPNWRLCKASELEELKGHHSRKASQVIDWIGKDITKIKRFDAKLFVKFMGWYISEGNVYKDKHNYSISVYQSRDVHPENYKEISDLLDALGFKTYKNKNYIRFSDKKLFLYLSKLGKSKEKYIPTELKGLNKEMLKHLLDSLIKGDGRKNGNGYEYATISKRLADDVQEIALKCGYRSSLYSEIRPDKTIIKGKVVNQSPIIYLVSISPVSELYYPKPKKIKYNGKVIALTVKDNNHTIMVRRNGRPLWSGNCNPCSEMTWEYFDPIGQLTQGQLYNIYKPKPWKIKYNTWNTTGNLETVLIKRKKL